jgi:hypothetical protein
MSALNSSSAKLLVSKQSAIDTVPTSNIARLNWIDGNVSTKQVVLDQEVFDGETYSSPRQVVGRFEGGGSLKVLADNSAVRLIGQGLLGADDADTLSTDAPGDGDFYTIWTEVGSGANVVRRRFVNCKISELKLTGAASSQFIEMEFQVVCIDPQANITSMPSTYSEPGTGYTFADGSGSYEISGDVVAGISQFELTVQRDQAPWQGDSTAYYTVVPKRGMVEISATLIADDVSLPILNNLWYGTASPSNGQQPTAELFYDSFALTLTRGDDSLSITLPKVAYRTESALDPNLGGDAIELPIQGRAVKPDSGALATLVTETVSPPAP